MGNSYPTGPCKKPYDPGREFAAATLMNIKAMADQNGLQVEMIFKPSEVKIRFIKKIDKSVKKREVTLTNEELASKFSYQMISGMIFDVSMQ